MATIVVRRGDGDVEVCEAPLYEDDSTSEYNGFYIPVALNVAERSGRWNAREGKWELDIYHDELYGKDKVAEARHCCLALGPVRLSRNLYPLKELPRTKDPVTYIINREGITSVEVNGTFVYGDVAHELQRTMMEGFGFTGEEQS